MSSNARSSVQRVMPDTNRSIALRMYPANGAFVGSDLSGEVVKLGPNIQNDIKIGDVVGASVTGSTFSAPSWNLFAKTDHRQLHGGL